MMIFIFIIFGALAPSFNRAWRVAVRVMVSEGVYQYKSHYLRPWLQHLHVLTKWLYHDACIMRPFRGKYLIRHRKSSAEMKAANQYQLRSLFHERRIHHFGAFISLAFNLIY